MPVQKSGSGIDSNVDPYRRLSASQVIAHNSCPRYWFYGWERRMKSPLPPQIIRGNAAESCICRILRDSPVLVERDADDQMKSPLDQNGAPRWDVEADWPAPGLQTLEKSSWPVSIDSLREWAHSRARIHFPGCWDEAVSNWLKNPNRKGSIEDADPEECYEMILQGIDFHLREVAECMESTPPELEEWRKGRSRPEWPSPDGFPRNWILPHPASQASGEEIHVVEAWEITRPWFVDPDAAAFTQTATHPEGWFQGEYDMVYRWGGRIRIIDLKASLGSSDRSHGYVDQLKMYAWLWYKTHRNQDLVKELEIWYLGAFEPKKVDLPSIEDMEKMDVVLHDLYSKIRRNRPSIEECPPKPSPLRRFLPGGVPVDDGQTRNPKSRCKRCDYAGICEGSGAESTTVRFEKIERFGHKWPITPIGESKSRFRAIGQVSKLIPPKLNEDGSIDIRFTLVDGWDRAVVRSHRSGGPSNVTRSISEGTRIAVESAMPSLWKGQLNLDLDSQSSIKIADVSEESAIVEIETRLSVAGRVWSIDAFPDGHGVNRWSITLVDSSGSASAVAFRQFIPTLAPSISRGDVIAVLNGEVGEWGGRPQIKMGPGTRVVVIDE